jgi:hypothetical protein
MVVVNRREGETMRNPYVFAAANFLFPGAGYLLAGVKRGLAVLWLAGVIGLTYVEFGIRESEPTLYAIMFTSVLIMNTAFAVDVFRAVTSEADAMAPQPA